MICRLMVFQPTIFQPFIFLRVDAHRLPVVFVRVRSEEAARVFPIQKIGKRYGVTPP
jgi:hypothetical protein